MRMNIKRLQKSIEIVKNGPIELSAQSLTYLRTYPSILDAVASLPRNPKSLISQVAVFAYGWMPRVARLDPEYFVKAGTSLVSVANAEGIDIDSEAVSNISECLRSVVGASKVLHFIRPDVYPIWDSKVAKVWHNNKALSQKEISDPAKYIVYVKALQELVLSNEAKDFLKEFKSVYEARLGKLNIARYVLSDMRAIEAAIFELSGGEYEDA
jgi:hypothetical protein